jgi:hypothetical protein
MAARLIDVNWLQIGVSGGPHRLSAVSSTEKLKVKLCKIIMAQTIDHEHPVLSRSSSRFWPNKLTTMSIPSFG